MVKEIKAYKTTDDSLFLKEEDAKKHQNRLDFRKGLDILVDKCIPYYDNKMMVFNFIDEHREELLELLKIV